MMETPSPSLSESELTLLVQEAWYNGRAVVPIVGAGLSVDSGMPAIQSVVRYIAKLAIYIDNRLYIPSDDTSILFKKHVKRFETNPWEFIKAFGWPDRFQLNFDVRRGIDNNRIMSLPEHSVDRGRMTTAIGLALDALAARINPGGTAQLRKYINAINVAAESWRSRMNLDLMLTAQELALVDPNADVDSFIYQVASDWKPLLREITGHQSSLVDSLFGRLARGRVPGLSHQFLAHLVQLLRTRTILTFNFDHLIEASLAAESIQHRVFSMESGVTLPAKALIDDSIAVVKMHGSTHNILADERVDHRLSVEYRRAFRQLVGPNPLLLVLGCSGNDRRLRELVEGVMQSEPGAGVIWVYRSEKNDVPIIEGSGRQLRSFASYDVGQSLRSLYTRLTSRLPTASAPYEAHIAQPLFRSRESSTRASSRGRDALSLRLWRNAISIISAQSREAYSANELMECLSRIPLGYLRVWVDLEEQHSLGQVLGTIVDQIRRGDSHIPPFVSSADPRLAARRVLYFLRRSRYVLCFANLDAFSWRPTTHHGTTSVETADDAPNAFKQLSVFLSTLADLLARSWSLGDSCIVLHSEVPYQRHHGLASEGLPMRQLSRNVNSLLRMLRKQDERRQEVQDASRVNVHTVSERAPWLQDVRCLECCNSPEGVDGGGEPQLKLIALLETMTLGVRKLSSLESDEMLGISVMWAALTMHRRTRITTGLSRLLNDLVSEGPRSSGSVISSVRRLIVDAPDSFSIPLPIRKTEGGGLWCDRPWRDAVYEYNTRLTSHEYLSRIECDGVASSVEQHIIVSALHDIVARNYYLNVYLPSRDCFAFLEYLYHRVSTLRYLAQLSVLLHSPCLCQNQPSEEFRRFVRMFGSRFGGDWAACLCGSRLAIANGGGFRHFADNSGESAWPLVDSVNNIRGRCIRGLAVTWARTEATLRRVLPADQLVSWCKTLLHYDLETHPTKAGPSFYGPGRVDAARTVGSVPAVVIGKITSQTSAEDEFLRVKENLISAIEDTLVKAHVEQAQFKRVQEFRVACRSRRERSEHVLTAVETTGADAVSEWNDPYVWNDLLDTEVALAWESFCAGKTAYRQGAHAVVDIVKEAALRASSDPVLAEAKLRADLLFIERELSQFSMVGCAFTDVGEKFARSTVRYDLELLSSNSRDRESRVRKQRSSPLTLDDLTGLERVAMSAMEFAREEYGLDVRGQVRNPLLEANAQMGLFLPYRSLIHIFLGRISTIKMVFAGRQSRAGAGVGEVVASAWEVQSRDAFREFANARGGIGAENSVLLAISDLCAAEHCLKAIECLYIQHDVELDRVGTELSGRVQSKVRSASGYLSRASAYLSVSSKHVLLWMFLHVFQCQYQVERMFFNLLLAFLEFHSKSDAIDSDTRTAKRIQASGELMDRVRKALAAVRSGLDHTAEGHRRFLEEFRSQWCRIGCVATAAAMIRYGVYEREPFRTFIDPVACVGDYPVLASRLSEFWVDLNDSAGVVVSIKNGKCRDYGWGDGWNSILIKSSSVSDDGENVVELRERIARLFDSTVSEVLSFRKWVMCDFAKCAAELGGSGVLNIE